MFLPLDRQRQLPIPSARAFAGRVGLVVRSATWHGMNPRLRQRFVYQNRATVLRRHYVRVNDAWLCPVYYFGPSEEDGEPILLIPELGIKPSAYCMGEGGGIVGALRRARFSVYILGHRGTHESVRLESDKKHIVDGIWRNDIPAALEWISQRSGHHRTHIVGHGFGGQMALAYAGTLNDGRMASLSTLNRRSTIRIARRLGYVVLAKNY